MELHDNHIISIRIYKVQELTGFEKLNQDFILTNKAIAMSEEFQQIKDAYTLYEAGKKRRYDLLFAVNGGAFAIAQLLNNSPDKPLGGLSLPDLAIGMAVFTILMVWDISKYRTKIVMRRENHQILDLNQ
jgi:hypothetical protein